MNKSQDSCLGLGGNHYAERFTRKALDENIAFRHIILVCGKPVRGRFLPKCQKNPMIFVEIKNRGKYLYPITNLNERIRKIKHTKMKAIIILGFILLGIIILLGLTRENYEITGAYSVDFFEENLNVTQYTQDNQCAGTEDEPCIAKVQFRALKNFTANPSKMIEVDKPEMVKIITEDKDVNFEIGHIYTLTYQAYKTNPAEAIKWSWGPIE